MRPFIGFQTSFIVPSRPAGTHFAQSHAVSNDTRRPGVSHLGTCCWPQMPKSPFTMEIKMTTGKSHSGGLFLAGMLVVLPAAAADLAPDAVRKLVSGMMWTTEKMLNSTQLRSFDWKRDGTLCLRLGSTSGKCDDNGTWKIDGQRVCYQLTWWMKSYDLASACLNVADLGNGRYEAKIPSGSTFMEFTVTP
jgi:hypothetical protein